jgi:hypothetical protein
MASCDHDLLNVYQVTGHKDQERTMSDELIEVPDYKRDFMGPYDNPYHVLGFQPLGPLTNPVPMAPLADLMELHNVINDYYRRLQATIAQDQLTEADEPTIVENQQ